MADNPIARMWRTFRAVARFDTFEPDPALGERYDYQFALFQELHDLRDAIKVGAPRHDEARKAGEGNGGGEVAPAVSIGLIMQSAPASLKTVLIFKAV